MPGDSRGSHTVGSPRRGSLGIRRAERGQGCVGPGLATAASEAAPPQFVFVSGYLEDPCELPCEPRPPTLPRLGWQNRSPLGVPPSTAACPLFWAEGDAGCSWAGARETVHAGASRLATCRNVWWRLHSLCAQHSQLGDGGGACGPQGPGCWHLASHLQLRVQPRVSAPGTPRHLFTGREPSLGARGGPLSVPICVPLCDPSEPPPPCRGPHSSPHPSAQPDPPGALTQSPHPLLPPAICARTQPHPTPPPHWLSTPLVQSPYTPPVSQMGT